MTTRPRLPEVHGFVPVRPGLLPQWPGCIAGGEGEPVVMLHASLASKLQWAALGKRLLARFRAIALDLSGYGDNLLPAAQTSFTLDDEVRLVASHVNRLVAPHVRVHLVGHSYGAVVALRFAQTRGEQVASLSLYEPVAFGVLDEADVALAGIRPIAGDVRSLIDAGRRDDAARAFVDFWSGGGSFAALSPRAQASAARGIDKVPLDFSAASQWRPDANALRAISAPTLLMSGLGSPPVVQRIAGTLAVTLPNRRTAAFDAGHMAPLTHPDIVNPWFEAFIDMHADRGRVHSARSRYFTGASYLSAAD